MPRTGAELERFQPAAERRQLVDGLCALVAERRDARGEPIVGARRDVARLASDIIRIGSSSESQATRAREMRQTLSCSNVACCETLKSLLHAAFVYGRKGESNSDLNQATDHLLILLQGKPRHLQQLLIRAYSMGLKSPVFDFQQVAIA